MCSSLFQMVVFGYSIYFKSPKLPKTDIFRFFFQNLSVWPPGETSYVVLGCCKALCLIGNAFLCISNSVFWVFDIFQKLKIAKNSYFFVFFTKFSRSTPWWESTGIMILMQKTFSIATLTIFSEKHRFWVVFHELRCIKAEKLYKIAKNVSFFVKMCMFDPLVWPRM